MQLAVGKLVENTEYGEALGKKLDELETKLGKALAEKMSGIVTLDVDSADDQYLIGGGKLLSSILTGAVPGGPKGKGGTRVTIEGGPINDHRVGAKGPLLPDSNWKNKEAPTQVTPGTTRVVDIKPSSRKKDEFYERTTHYDEYGRSKGQTHMTDHGQPDVHPNPHHHVRDVERNQNVKGARPGVHPDY